MLDGILEAIFTWLGRIVMRKAQSLNPRFTTYDGRRCLVLSPNRVSVVFWILGFLFFASWCVAMCLVTFSGFEPTERFGTLFSLLMALPPFALALGMLYGSVHAWRSRVFVFTDGLLFAFFMRKRRFLKWSDVGLLEYLRGERQITILSRDGVKFRLDCHWNGIAFLFFCFESFLREDQWHEVKEGMVEYLRKRGDLDDIRDQLAESLSDEPLDTYEPAVEGGAKAVPPA